MFPLALACDAVLTETGEMIGDPTEGALVVLAEKGGLDLTLTRERYPRVAELPFDTAYKLMATFHRMTDEAGEDVDPLLRQGRAGPAARARVLASRPGAGDRARSTTRSRTRYLGENERLAAQGPARDGHRAQGLRPGRRSTRAPTC